MTKAPDETKDPICGMTVDEATRATPNTMERRSTFAATTAGKSFCPRPPDRSPRKSLAAVAGNIRAHEPGDRSQK